MFSLEGGRLVSKSLDILYAGLPKRIVSIFEPKIVNFFFKFLAMKNLDPKAL
jgi:hypothetical protein